MAISGPYGAGKTETALRVARGLVGPEGRIALLDTEHGAASKYAHKVSFDTECLDLDFHPDRLCRAIDEMAKEGYGCGIIDSLSSFWNGDGGLLELVDKEADRLARSGKRDSHAAWRSCDPIYRRMTQAVLAAPFHLILTMRAKQEYVREDEGGKVKIRKLGMTPEMRDSFQGVVDIDGMMDMEHRYIVGKTRVDGTDGQVFTMPGQKLADICLAWLSIGEKRPETPAAERLSIFQAIVRDIAEAKDSDALAKTREQILKAKANVTPEQYDLLIQEQKARHQTLTTPRPQ